MITIRMKKYSLLTFLLLVILSVPFFAGAEVISLPNTSSCVTINNNLQYLSKDSKTKGDVTRLQRFLHSSGYLVQQPTGSFGRATVTAVRAFQKANGISVQGNVGPATRAKIKAKTCAMSISGMSSAPVISPNLSTVPLSVCGPGVIYNTQTGALCSGSSVPLSGTSSMSVAMYVNGSPTSATITDNMYLNVTWTSAGTSKCYTTGTNFPIVNGGHWLDYIKATGTSSAYLQVTGSEKLMTGSAGAGMYLGLTCEDDKGNATSTTVPLPLSTPWVSPYATTTPSSTPPPTPAPVAPVVPIISNVHTDKTSYSVGDVYTLTWNFAHVSAAGLSPHLAISLWSDAVTPVLNLVNTCDFVTPCLDISPQEGSMSYTGVIPPEAGTISHSVSNGTYRFTVSLIAGGSNVTHALSAETVSIPFTN